MPRVSRKRLRAAKSKFKRAVKRMRTARQTTSDVAGYSKTSKTTSTPNVARSGGLLGLEKKYYDVSIRGAQLGILVSGTDWRMPITDSTATATNATLNSMIQGDTASSRDGRLATITNISVRGVIRDATGGNYGVLNGGPVTICIVNDRQANGTLALGGDVWDTALPSQDGQVDNFRDLEKIKRFQILAKIVLDMRVHMNYDTTIGNFLSKIDEMPFALDWNGKIVSSYIRGASASETYANTQTNSIHLFAWQSYTAGVHPPLYMVANIRTRYYDQ